MLRGHCLIQTWPQRTLPLITKVAGAVAYAIRLKAQRLRLKPSSWVGQTAKH